MAFNSLIGDYHFKGRLSSESMTLPANTVTNAGVDPNAAIDPTKLASLQFALRHSQANGADVASRTEAIHVARGDGAIVGVEAALTETAAAGAATVTIDVQKSTGGAAFASVLTAVLTLNSATALRTAVAQTLASPDYAEGDVFQLVITAAAGGGTLPRGLVVTVTLREAP